MLGVCRDALARWEVEPREPDRRNMPSIIRFLGYDPQPCARTLAELIRRTRRALGLNQPQMAEALGVPTGTLNAWERGLYEPPVDRRRAVEAGMEALSAVLNSKKGLGKTGERKQHGQPEGRVPATVRDPERGSGMVNRRSQAKRRICDR